MRRLLVLLCLCGLLAGCGPSAPTAPAADAADAPSSAQRGDLRDVRYCEILVITRDKGRLQGVVYNTLGLNDCPAAQWQALDPEKIKRDFGAVNVVMNGPRYFLMDSNALQDPGAVASFDGLELRALATFSLPAGSLLGGERAPYTETVIDRTTEYVFKQGQSVYELVDPRGQTYVMQSYAQIVDPALKEADLATLAGRLSLPAGWSYRARRLDADLVVRSGGAAHVITDDLSNTYQRVDR
jgi:hypothetical protein